MRTVGSRELKNRLGRYLGLVGKGETIIVTDRGKPVARLLPPEPEQAKGKSVSDVLKELEAEGQLRLGTQPFKRIKPMRVKGKPMSQMILEDRD
jgi:prevent-host-death family protein